jgi:inorganic pyrophosphatase
VIVRFGSLPQAWQLLFALALGDAMLKKSAKREKKNELDVIVETPRGRRNKFKLDAKTGDFRLWKVLPAGSSFPYDFGFLPGTKADDGDPLDVLLLMDESAFPGCIVRARIIGVIQAEQEEDGHAVRNDRIVAVAKKAHDYADICHIRDINENLLHELEQFFISYNQASGRPFKVLGTKGPKHARKLIDAATVKAKKAK